MTQNHHWYPPTITHTAATPMGSLHAIGGHTADGGLYGRSSLNFYSSSILSIDRAVTQNSPETNPARNLPALVRPQYRRQSSVRSVSTNFAEILRTPLLTDMRAPSVDGCVTGNKCINNRCSPVADLNQCNGGIPSTFSLTLPSNTITALQSRPVNSTLSQPQGRSPPPTSLQWQPPLIGDQPTSPLASIGNEKRLSIVHEIKPLTPNNSLGGVFYCSSVISRRNSSTNDSGADQKDTGTAVACIGDENGKNPIKLIPPLFILPKRKFCAYFKWYDWMSKRDEYSLFIFPPDNRLRQQCTQITEHQGFDYVILIFISLNCITLAMERPKIPPWSLEREFLTFANYVFTFVFAVEMALKVVAKGLWYSDDAYFKSGWNIMDGILVGVSLFDLFLSFIAQRSPRIFGILRVFRLLRSLRPLRVINRAPGLKLVVQTLLSSLRPIGNIVLICCTFFIIFGILGVQLFKGALFYCEGPDVRNIKNRTDCLSDIRNRWVNRKYNFDNLGQALMALFVLSSKDGWVNIMYTGLDAVGVDQQPSENYNEWRLLYFLSFLLLVAFFVLNMFVGVVVENFHRCREEQEKEERARRAEKRARKLDKRRRNSSLHGPLIETLNVVFHPTLGREMREPPYYIGYSNFRLFIHGLVTGKYFDVIIAAVIGLNVVTMSLEHYQMPRELVYTLKMFNFVFTGVFVCEAIMKLYALDIRRYMKDKWNQLDVLIVILSIVGIILEEMESELIPINPTIIRVMRVARIARVLKLLKMAKGMRALLNTVMQALPQVGNLGLLFFLLFFIFAALGVELFGRLECDEDHPCQGLSEHAHFQNFGMAFLTLFRVATGDNWNGVMKDTLRDQCDASSDCLRNCCVSPIIAPLYFVVFVLLAQFVLVNVVVAVLMKHLEESHKNMEEDEDYEIDMEIAREIAAEKRALQEAIARKQREEELRKKNQCISKVLSLPANFRFSFGVSTSPSTEQPLSNLKTTDDNGEKSLSERRNMNNLLIKIDSAESNDPTDNDGENKQIGDNCDEIGNKLEPNSPCLRKLSDVTIVDEESMGLTQCLLPPYPEFSPDNDDASNDNSLTWTGNDGESGEIASSNTSLSITSELLDSFPQESQL